MELNAGGTALNVARATAALGHRSGVMGTLGDDPSGRLIHKVLAEERVDMTALSLDRNWRTPVLLQVPKRGDHAWQFSCPDCGTRLPKYRPSPPGKTAETLAAVPAPRVLLLDRVSRFSLSIADEWRRQGTFVLFEPATLGREDLFRRALSVAHLVKFSSTRADEFRAVVDSAELPQVETMGVAGVRWRLDNSTRWTAQAAPDVANVVDTAGAGDWTTAGMMARLLDGVPLGENELSNDSIARALSEGQRLGSLACTWRGPFRSVDSEIARHEFEQFACPRVLATGN